MNKNYEKLKFEWNGETTYLPTWYIDSTDEEIEKIKEEIINSEPPKVNNESFEDIDWNKLENDLKSAGYSENEREKIMDLVACGRTLDSAMQSI